jgi:uncharacterized protein
MKVFIDTSAIYALGSKSDEFHEEAKKKLQRLTDENVEFVTSNYILLECISLLQTRQGVKVTKELINTLITGISIVWVNEEMHERSWKYWLGKSKESLSLVDCSSFILMEKDKIAAAFSFDRHFISAGKTLV